MKEGMALTLTADGLSEAVGKEDETAGKVAELANLLLVIRTAKESLDSVIKELNKSKQHIQRRFVARMEAEKLDQCVTAGHKFTLKAKGYFSLPPKNQAMERAAVIKALREDPQTAPLVYDDVVSRTLNAYCAEQLEKGGEIPDGIRSYIETAVSIRQVND